MIFLPLILFSSVALAGNFNPFSDDELFAIHWAGFTDLERLKEEKGDLEIVSVQTEEDERYQCIIPESQADIDATRKASYHGPTPEELMEALFIQSSCSYRIESYWTYELCHGKHIRQYHEDKELALQKPKIQEYFLGRMKPETDKKEGAAEVLTPGPSTPDTDQPTTQEKPEKQQQEILNVKIDGLDLPYFSVNMTDGTVCDLTGKPRVSHVKYICQPNGRGEIFQLKETSSCEYDVLVLTAVLCPHPSFKPKDPPVSKINCHPVGSSPLQPRRLTKLMIEQGIQLELGEEDEEPVPPPPPSGLPSGTPPQEKPRDVQPKPPPSTNIGKEADHQLLRDFLSGTYCIHGGGGWWKHEFCYNRHAKQYHEEAGASTTIYLGHWDKSKHEAWLKNNPSKKPRPAGHRKHISLFYSGGDVCDLTGKQRFVEVKLKCLQNTNQPHAVTIYLVEPAPCEYTLGVESPLFCDILDRADDDGLFDHIKV